MPGFHLYRSSSTQALADRFVETVTAPGAALPVEEDELVIVQGRGMERWLSQRAAARLGVWAGARFPYPRAAAAELAARVLGQAAPARVADDALVLAFAVAGELPALANTAAGERVKRYLRSDSARILPFAQQAAGALDGYLVFRPDLLDQWSRVEPASVEDPDERWQCALWRAVQARARTAGEDSELARLVDFWPRVRRATQKLTAGAVHHASLPTRVNVFAVAGAAPQLVDFFASLGRVSDVHWYAVDPAAETAGSPAGIVHSLGLADLESVHVVTEAAERAEAAGVSVHVEVLPAADTHAPATTLARVQRLARRGVLDADERSATVRGGGLHGAAASGAVPLDRSLRVHSCPGRTREVEVLHDELLRAFEELPGLRPEDVAVLVPDIAAYAPAVEAVLGGGRGVARIPAAVADTSERDGSPVATALSFALRLADGDMGLRTVADLLGQPVLAEQFLPTGIASDDVAQWLQSAGARRFLNAHHRELAGLPHTEERTWDTALDSLYAGLAAAPGAVEAVEGSSVYPAQPFMSDAASLGRVSEFVELLAALRTMAVDDSTGNARERTVPQWMEQARDVLLRMAPVRGDGEREARALTQQMASIEGAAVAAGFEAPVPFAAMRTVLLERLCAGRPGRGFLAGGVTICQLVPMRAVPFRVVCMLGMNDTGFPRPNQRVGFDLLAREQRPGDRDSRAEDRALFLESVLGAGERLVVIYPGREQVGGTECAPSTAVAELLDAAAAVNVSHAAAPSELAAAREALVVEHPLHAFSVRAWDESAALDDRVGYDAQAQQAAQLLASGSSAEPRPFLVARAAGGSAADSQRPIELEELQSFFRDPSKQTLRDMGVRLRRTDEVMAEHESIEISKFEEGGLRHELLKTALAHAGSLPADADERFWRRGDLPVGEFGRAYARQVVGTMRQLLATAYPGGVDFHLVDVTAGEFRVVGQVPVVDGALVVAVSSKKVESRHVLRGWIQQLALAASGDGAPEGTLRALVGNPTLLRAVGGAEAKEHLRSLCALMRFGRVHGLPFFEGISERAFKQHRTGASEAEVLEKMRDHLMGDPDAYSPEARALFRGGDQLQADCGSVPGVCDARLVPVACAVFEPMEGKQP